MKKRPINSISCWLIIIISFVFCFNQYAQVNEVRIEHSRFSEKVLIVWGGKIYKDQVAAIATKKGIVIIDTGKSPTLTQEYRRIIERELKRNDFIYVINTHYHFDHTSGNQVFSEAQIIAHQKTPGMMKKWAADRQTFVDKRRAEDMIKWANQRDEAEPGTEIWERYNDIVTTGVVMLDDYENNYELTLPSITFTDRLTLDLGDVTLNLYYWGEGMHTGDDILIHYPQEKLLFSGDLFYKGYFGFAFQADFEIERWISILNQIFIDEISIDWVYDCHNGRMTGEYIFLYYNYMSDVLTSLLKAKKIGMKFDAVLKEYSYENKFRYISKSGLESEILKRGHADNLKFTWLLINGLVDQ